jgi:hypothetical protein
LSTTRRHAGPVRLRRRRSPARGRRHRRPLICQRGGMTNRLSRSVKELDCRLSVVD